MKYFSLLSPPLLYLHLLFLLTLNLIWSGPNKIRAVAAIGNQTDHLALLKFKESITSDPYKALESWNSSIHFCKWHGITCSPMHERVTELRLERYQLHGSLSPHVCNLTFLKTLDIGNNNFFGEIPQELGQLLHLQRLFLSNNSFVGEIPTNLTYCSNLKLLFLSGNHLIGKIPIEIGSLIKLQAMTVSNNNLTGGIPSFIGNLSCLQLLGLAENNLSGKIPQEICCLKHLTILALFENNVSGKIPSCLYNISSLIYLGVTQNNLHGSFPPNMFHTLPNLKFFNFGGNQFSGPIPISIANASSLQSLDLGHNMNLVGQVPSLGNLQDLSLLNLESNNLGNISTMDLEFLKYLTNCSKLIMLSICYNNFGGNLPNSIGNLSTELKQLYMGGNQISGKIPAELGRLVGLILLTMGSNSFEGIIPTTFGKFQKIQVLSLRENKLSGDIPPFIGNLSQLFKLKLDHNMFQGSIPPSIGNCQNLQVLDLSHNMLRGTIPVEVLNLFSLSMLLNLSHNSLSGTLPREVGMLKNIEELDVSENHLSGDIPREIGECTSLEYIHLQRNSFNGTMPSSLDSLKGLRYLDLSRNQLSGSIPDGMQNISVLEYLNVSFNMLEGEVPTNGVFGNATQIEVIGNKKLCGGISHLHLPPCPIKGRKHAKQHKFRLIAVIVSVVSFILILSFIITITAKQCPSWLLILHCDLKPSNVLLDDDMVAHVSDFGIARLVSTISGTSHKNTSTIGIKGTVGYAPPEYGMGSEVSTCGDMYSFGILMLEMLTGRRPTDELFEDGQNLHKFVTISFPGNLIKILDPHLLPRAEDGNHEILIPTAEECLVSLFRIGLLCSLESPKERMNIVDVTRELSTIQKVFLAGLEQNF